MSALRRALPVLLALAVLGVFVLSVVRGTREDDPATDALLWYSRGMHRDYGGVVGARVAPLDPATEREWLTGVAGGRLMGRGATFFQPDTPDGLLGIVREHGYAVRVAPEIVGRLWSALPDRAVILRLFRAGEAAPLRVALKGGEVVAPNETVH